MAGFAHGSRPNFPAAAIMFDDAGRREFLKMMGASLLLAGLAGCGEERSDLALPYVNQPEEIDARRAALLRDRGAASRAMRSRCSPRPMQAGRPSSTAIPIIR